MSNPISITKDGRTFALFFHHDLDVDGARFLTSDGDSLQVGVFEREAGYQAKPHRHPERDIRITKTYEFLYVQRGKMKVTIFNDDWSVLREEDLSAGDAVLFMDGGHSTEMLEDTRFFEVKQGPFPGDSEAKIFRD